ncbi:hypothetical protein [Thaumasiovibrio subtropicus]|uniref:hypothetical protein n=1 Tax=Thaumasiovibrio subtropicus TaxID=1891207 RepID=UPI000B35CE48|nr:hypothetical protein [Thaumasiovibrio subtropicus]
MELHEKVIKYLLQWVGVCMFAYAGSLGVVNTESQVLSVSGLGIFFCGFAMRKKRDEESQED